MKVRVLVLLVVLGLVGCGKSSPTTGQDFLPVFGGAVAIATISDGSIDYQILTYNEALDIVCIENGTSPTRAARGSMAAFSCWETSVAPKKMQELVTRYLNGKK